MTIDEAKQALRNGHSVRHRFFCDGENITLHGSRIFFEDDLAIPCEIFWNDRTGEAWQTDWDIVKEKEVES